MSGPRIIIESRPKGLVLDEAAIAAAMGAKAQEILRRPGRIPARTGEFAASIEATPSGENAVEVGPTGERNETIARVFKKRGIDLFAFSEDERAEIVAAAQEALEAQIRAGHARLE